MIRTALIALAAAFTLPLSAAEWTMLPDSRLGFVASAQGESFEGRFARFSAQIRFDPAALEGAAFEVTIEPGSVDTQNAERDELLPAPDFFDVGTHPQARYRATRFEDLGAGRYRALGELSLRGTTQPVALDFAWVEDGAGNAQLQGEASLSRLAFGVGGGDWADTEMIDDAVTVRTTLQLRRTDAGAQ